MINMIPQMTGHPLLLPSATMERGQTCMPLLELMVLLPPSSELSSEPALSSSADSFGPHGFARDSMSLSYSWSSFEAIAMGLSLREDSLDRLLLDDLFRLGGWRD